VSEYAFRRAEPSTDGDRLRDLFDRLPWWDLVPDLGRAHGLLAEIQRGRMDGRRRRVEGARTIDGAEEQLRLRRALGPGRRRNRSPPPTGVGAADPRGQASAA
jgi:hypothetical protein